MPQFLITYDEHHHRDYKPLDQLMASWNAVRIANSVWLANLKGPAPAVRNIVASKLRVGDTIAVVELKQGSDWATINVNAAAETWLATNIMPAQKAA